MLPVLLLVTLPPPLPPPEELLVDPPDAHTSRSQPSGHVVSAPLTQVPEPLHVDAVVALPEAHDAAPHAVPNAGTLHEKPVPSQLPPQGPEPGHVGWPVCGAPFTAVHVPTEPGRLQAPQLAAHTWLQQTPSVQ